MFENNVMEKGFPENLYYDLTDGDMADAPDDVYATIMYLLYRLPERKAEIILNRYRDGLPYRTIGEMYGVSGSRIEKIVSESIDSMRIYNKILLTGVEGAINRKDEPKEVVEETNDETTNYGAYESWNIANLDFTTRTENALNLRGVSTVADIIRIGNGLSDIPNLGKKCLNEIVTKLDEIGVDVRKYFNRVIIMFRLDI